jgi:hypothetical protein
MLTNSKPSNPHGTLDLFRAKGGKVGLDACVPAAIALKTMEHWLPGAVLFSVFESGRALLEAHVSSAAAEKVIAEFAGAGVIVRR